MINRKRRVAGSRFGWERILSLTLFGALAWLLLVAGMDPQADAAEGVDAIRDGKAVPVVEVLAAIRERFQEGRVLKLELDQEWRPGGRIWVYEAKVLMPNGDVLEVEYDALSLEVIDLKGPGQD